MISESQCKVTTIFPLSRYPSAWKDVLFVRFMKIESINSGKMIIFANKKIRL
jgi:hypothetical protein